MRGKTHFVFDLDGTLTAVETLPMIGTHFGLEAQIAAMTERAVMGTVPYVENFISRVNLLAGLPVDAVARLLASVPLHERLFAFVRTHAPQCSIATTNLDVWLARLAERIPCALHCSKAAVERNAVKELLAILKKETVVHALQEEGWRVVFIGDGHNDMEAMRAADLSIASGLTHSPAPGVLSLADYLCCEENALCRLLERLC